MSSNPSLAAKEAMRFDSGLATVESGSLGSQATTTKDPTSLLLLKKLLFRPTLLAPHDTLCRFCHDDEPQGFLEDRLISPCECKGSLAFVHTSCLRAWRHSRLRLGKDMATHCETCGAAYRLNGRLQWLVNIIDWKTVRVAAGIGALVASLLGYSCAAQLGLEAAFRLALDRSAPDLSVPARLGAGTLLFVCTGAMTLVREAPSFLNAMDLSSDKLHHSAVASALLAVMGTCTLAFQVVTAAAGAVESLKSRLEDYMTEHCD